MRTAIDFEAISDFLRRVDHESLFDYYGVHPDAPRPVIEQAIASRRRWAQAQQANPKYRVEAVWLIRNNSRVKGLLLDEIEAYKAQLRVESQQSNLNVLSLFIRGTMYSGVFTAEAEAAARRQGENLGIPPDILDLRIEALLAENGAVRTEAAPQPPLHPPRNQDASRLLAETIRDALGSGQLTSEELNHILAAGQSEQLDEEALLVNVQRAIAARNTRQGPPPRRPAQRPQAPVHQRPQRPQAPQHSVESQRAPTQDRAKAMREVVDVLRGSMLQGVLGSSTRRMMVREAQRHGLAEHEVLDLYDRAERLTYAFADQREDPLGALGLPPGIDKSSLRSAYQELRSWAWSHPEPLQCARTSVRLDAAWAAIQDTSRR